MAASLGLGVLDVVRRRQYLIADQPRIDLVADEALARGDIEVDPGPEPSGPDPAGAAAGASSTMVLPSPGPMGTAFAAIRIDGPGDRGREVAVDRLPMTIGRSHDNGLVLADREVSRHHARIAAQRGRLVLSDLGSTNGVLVNGRRVREVGLAAGDRITLGRTTLVVEPRPDGAKQAQ